jgi:thymidylate synthase
MYIKAQNLPDAWFQALYNLVDYDENTGQFKNSYLYTIQQGSYAGNRRLEFPFVIIEIQNPLDEPLLPYFPEGMKLPPVADMEYVYDYFTNYLMSPHIPSNTEYTYGSRICTPVREGVTQLDLLISRLQDHPRSNQLVLQIADPHDILLTDAPCLRSVSFKVVEDRLDFHIHMRSNHIWNGFPVNLASIALLMKYTLLYVPDLHAGKFIYFCSGLHLYEHDFDLAAVRLFKPDIPFGDAECCEERTLKNLLEDMGIQKKN